jgi:hypothetical protein
MLLKKADVFIQNGNNGVFDVIATESSYSLVRSVLITLKSEFGLPVDFHSEEVAAAVQNTSAGILVIDKVKVYKDLRFKVCAWQINCGSSDKLRELSKEVAAHLKQVGLEVSNSLE